MGYCNNHYSLFLLLFYFFYFQRRRNAGTQQNNQQQNVLVEFAFALCLFIRSRDATMALEDLLREKETYLKFCDSFFTFFLCALVTYTSINLSKGYA